MINHPTIPFSYNLMAKPSGSLCNLQCDYCYYSGKKSVGRDAEVPMNDKILEEFVKQYIQTNASQVVVFNWQGGEPLMAGKSFYEKAMVFQQKYAGKKGSKTPFRQTEPC